jgi:hypothetical protein
MPIPIKASGNSREESSLRNPVRTMGNWRWP